MITNNCFGILLHDLFRSPWMFALFGGAHCYLCPSSSDLIPNDGMKNHEREEPKNQAKDSRGGCKVSMHGFYCYSQYSVLDTLLRVSF
jgi:hypothetical protein